MQKTKKFAVIMGSAATLGLLFGASAFADSRRQDETWRDNKGRVERRDDRRDERRNDREEANARRAVTMEGKIRSMERDGDGFRVQLDRARDSFFVPGHVANAYRNRGGLRVGINIRFGGWYDPRGWVHVSSADWLDDDHRYRNDGYYDDYYDDYGHDRGTVRGIVERIDYRRGTLSLRDSRSGRYVTVAMVRRGGYRNRGVDFDDLRRGDYVTLAGEWVRGNVFEAYRIEGVRSR